MTLTPEAAKIIADYTLKDYEQEYPTTRRVIEALPANGEAYAPSGKCMKSLDLAWHIAFFEPFFLNGVAEGRFTPPSAKRPDHVKSPQDVLAWYDQNLPLALARARGLTGEQAAQEIDFFGVMRMPAVSYLTLMVKHGAHHRGQLSAYLRPMGAKVPCIYGPSADSNEVPQA